MKPRVKREAEAAAFDKLRWDRNVLRGTDPQPEEKPPQPPAQAAEAPPASNPPVPLLDEFVIETPGKQTRKKRAAKVTGLQIVLQSIKIQGFPRPSEGHFLMIPRVFKALLCLEHVSVIQVVYEVFEQTVGWADTTSAHGRREWARLSIRDFELACGMDTKQVLRGLKRALQEGYILRRPAMGSHEYSVRWAEKVTPEALHE